MPDVIKIKKGLDIKLLGEAEKKVAEVEETTPAATQAEQPVKEKDPQEFLENFDWEKYEEGIERVEDDKLKEFEDLVAKNFVDTADSEVVEGTVTHLTDREAIIDINAKSEGVISLKDYDLLALLALGVILIGMLINWISTLSCSRRSGLPTGYAHSRRPWGICRHMGKGC